MRRAIAVVGVLALGCVPTEFEDRRAEASTRALAPPDDYPHTGFGAVVTGYGGTLGGVEVSRVSGSAGADTPFTVYPLVVGDLIDLDTPVVDGCDGESPCSEGAGISLLGMPGWLDRELCLGVPASNGDLKIRCEDDVTRPMTIPGPGGQRFGFAGAALRADHPWGRAIIGAPGAPAVYRLPDGAGPTEIDLSLADGVGGELGRAVAIAALDADTVLFAAGAPIGAAKRVVVATADVAGDGSVTTSVRGCLDSPTEGWGAALAIGDLDGDGVPEVVVGSAPGGARIDAVRIYDGASMPGPDTCDGSWTHALELPCPSVEGVACDEESFGQTMAIGDLDGDGVGDLLVGSPAAEVDGVTEAGAVFVFRGGELGTLGSTDRVAVLTHSRPSREDRLGTSIAVAPGLDGRDEPVVGAPGAERMYVFLCSGLDGDTEATTPQERCQPR